MPAEAVPAHRAVALLYTDHHGWLHGWLRKRLGNADHAADLAHDTYVRIIGSGRLPCAGEARPHLMQVAKGLVIDRHRRQSIERAYLEALQTQPPAMAPSPEQQAIAVQALLRIDAMLDRLPARVRSTFLLSQLDGLTYSAIALRQGIAVGTVRKYMLQAMQACVDGFDEDDAPAMRHGQRLAAPVPQRLALGG